MLGNLNMKVKPKIKINLVLTGLIDNEFEKDSGGIQLSEISFSENLAKFSLGKIDLTVFARGESKKNKNRKMKNGGFKIKIIPSYSSYLGGIYQTWDFSHRVDRFLSLDLEKGPQIIHFTSIGPALTFLTPEFWYFKKRKKFSTAVCYTLYNFHYSISQKPYDIFTLYPDEWKFLHDEERKIVLKSDFVFVPSFNFVDYLERKFRREIIYLPNTIGSIKTYGSKCSELFREKDYFMILSMCRLAREKNLRRVIKSFSYFKKTKYSVGFKLFIAGDGEEKGDLISYGNNLGLRVLERKEKERLDSLLRKAKNNDVIFLGKIVETEKKKIWNLSDIFFLPSLREVSPLVGLEALAYGKPIVASNIYGWKDIKDIGGIIYLCNPQNVLEMAYALSSCVSATLKYKRKIFFKQREVYRRYYSPEVVIPRRIKIYEKIMKRITK